MKTLEQLFKEMNESEALKAAFSEAAETDKVDEFLKENDCEASLEELIDYVKEKENASGKLSAEELKEVSGGRNKKCVTLFGKRLCI